ncbi:protein SON [Drosophila guanche]|uniref:SNRNP25 ubiquitin-like domain-containing protein n=1 Tax=Drosophila guanche TaxID=7266 RepID=A0A3B0JGA6_DROGU|nr:protein SON [Drosophila guanche]SPP81424.1 Hypothetical predicted protein [Drosophila guanche]
MDRGEYKKEPSPHRRERSSHKNEHSSSKRRSRSRSHERERSSHRKETSSHKRKHSSRQKDRSRSRDRSTHKRKRSSHGTERSPQRKEGATSRHGRKMYSPQRREESSLTSTQRRERSPNRRERSPNRGERSPTRRERSPKRRERSPNRRERSPRRKERSPHRGKYFPHKERLETGVLTYKKLLQMPINLRKKAIREARNRNEKILSNCKRKKRKSKAWITARRQCNAAERAEHNDLVDSTEQELRQILDEFGELSDIPYDCTATELLGEIAIAEGNATTIYVERDGLSTLTIVLHEPVPTIAQLKKAIAVISRAEHNRRQRERHEESLRRRGLAEDGGREDRQQQRQRQQQVAVGAMPSSTGELVYSTVRNGHDHRAFVSWRFLWRCFGLFNVETNQPIDDRSNGRATLKELGIENAATLKFVHRVKYFGCQRQR